jgi:hypothetical protein
MSTGTQKQTNQISPVQYTQHDDDDEDDDDDDDRQ